MKGIKNFFKGMWNKAQNKAAEAAVKAQGTLVELKEEERGATDMVTIVVIIVVILVLAAVFHDQIVKIIKAVGSKVLSWIGD